MTTPAIHPRVQAELSTPAGEGDRHNQMKRLLPLLLGDGHSPEGVFACFRGMYGDDVTDREIGCLIEWGTKKDFSPTQGHAAPYRGERENFSEEQKLARYLRNTETYLDGFRALEIDLLEASPIRLLDDFRGDARLLLEQLYHPRELVNINADYRLAEKRLLDAVDEVFTRYRDRVSAEFRRLERELNIVLETPKPQSRLFLSQASLEISIRYPADARSAAQIADEVSRRVLDAIGREPSLRLATQGIANIQAQEAPPITAADGHPSADRPDNGQADNAAVDDKTPDEKKDSGPAPTEK